MNEAVDILVDPDDDVATTRAIHRLAATQAGVLAISIAPDDRTAPAVAWAILAALGKRADCLNNATPRWEDAERWLIAHNICELVVLRSQHLKPEHLQQLATLGAHTSLARTLVYSASTYAPAPTITLEQLIARRRPPRAAGSAQGRWPKVPRSHPLRFRYDCDHGLTSVDFHRVDQLLADTAAILERWLVANPGASRADVTRAAGIVSFGRDPEHRYIRRCGTEIALISHGNATAAIDDRPARLKPIGDEQLRDAHAHTDEVAAGYRLVETAAGLPPDLIGLIMADQITDTAILGLDLPETAHPILRALRQRHGALFTNVAARRTAIPPKRPGSTTATPNDPAAEDSTLAATVAELIRGPAGRIRPADRPEPIAASLARLRDLDILELRHGAYRATKIALYSSYSTRRAAALSTDIHATRSTDNHRESH